MEEKIFAARLKSFRFVSLFILAFGVMLIINTLADGFDRISENGTILISGILTILVGFYFYRYSKKERKFIVNNTGIEYHTSNPDFVVSWDDMVLLKSYQEESKTTENLILMDKDEKILSVSTAFFDEATLKSAFRYIADFVKDRDNIKIEDDRKWLK